MQTITIPLTPVSSAAITLTRPVLHRVEWLAEALPDTNSKTVYDMIAAKQIPAECILRVGQRIFIRELQALQWLNGVAVTKPEEACDACR